MKSQTFWALRCEGCGDPVIESLEDGEDCIPIFRTRQLAEISADGKDTVMEVTLSYEEHSEVQS